MKNESNFFYVKETDIEECYRDLKLAEESFEKDPGNTKMKLRKVNEFVIKKIANNYNIREYEDISELIYKIYNKQEIEISRDIRDYMHKIRKSGNEETHNDGNSEDTISTVKLLEFMHNILRWYLKDLTKQINKNKQLNFICPSNFNNENQELLKIKDEIGFKDKKINELEKKLDKLKEASKDKSKDLTKLRKSISKINSEKAELEARDILLSKKIDEYDKELTIIEKKYKNDFERKVEDFKKEHSELEQSLNKQELTKVKEEILLKNNEIVKLKSKVTKLQDESKNKDELKKTINKINTEKLELEQRDTLLTKKTKEYDKELKRIEEKYKKDLEKQINELKKQSNQAQNLIIKEQLNNVKEQISLKDIEIDKLKKEVDGLEEKSNEINELRKDIELIQQEKLYLEKRDVLLNNKIREKNQEIIKIKEHYEKGIEEINQSDTERIRKLRKERNESQASLVKKETELIKSEQKNQELKRLIKELEEKAEAEAEKKEEEIKEKERKIEQELERLRQAYRSSFTLTKQYQDILEKSENAYDKEEEEKLYTQKINVKDQINFEDKVFDENLKNYTKKVDETKEKVRIFKEILNEKNISEGKYVAFYKGFLGLEGNQLRVLYTMLTKVNISSILINKSKELLSQSNEDKFMEYINKKADELKNSPDEHVKLKLYYRLIKLTKIPVKNICDRKQFIGVLDDIVDRAYAILEGKKDFQGGHAKLEAISTYYLEKVIADFKKKYDSGEIEVQEDLINSIYNNFQSLSYDERKVIYDKLHLESTSETAVSLLSFLTDPFMIILCIANGGVLFNQHQKQQEELVPLFIMQTVITNTTLDNRNINLKSYEKMIELWKEKQQSYNNISIQKKTKEKVLSVSLKTKEELDMKRDQLSKADKTLCDSYGKYRSEFNNIVLNSDKIKFLPSYVSYNTALNKQEEVRNNISETKNKLGILKSVFSKEMWKEQSTKFMNEANITSIEKTLVEEAKRNSYFKEEYQVFLDLQQKIHAINKLLNQTKEKIKIQNEVINNSRSKINELEQQLIIIKGEYLDMEQSIY